MAEKTQNAHSMTLFGYEAGAFVWRKGFQVRKRTFWYGDERQRLYDPTAPVAVRAGVMG